MGDGAISESWELFERWLGGFVLCGVRSDKAGCQDITNFEQHQITYKYREFQISSHWECLMSQPRNRQTTVLFVPYEAQVRSLILTTILGARRQTFSADLLQGSGKDNACVGEVTLDDRTSSSKHSLFVWSKFCCRLASSTACAASSDADRTQAATMPQIQVT